jgi:hypothetical protein
MSKQIAVLLDNSGSMFNPVGGTNPNTKIYETARGAEYFLENLIDELTANPGAEFALSVHRFASSYQLLPRSPDRLIAGDLPRRPWRDEGLDCRHREPVGEPGGGGRPDRYL